MKVTSVVWVITLMGVGNSWAEDVFKYVDENGRVTFTTDPKPGAKKIEMPAMPASKPLPRPKPLHTAKLISERKATSAETNSCFEQHRVDFLDPRTAYPVRATYRVVEYHKLRKGGKSGIESVIEVDVSARNGYGGAARTRVSCKTLTPS